MSDFDYDLKVSNAGFHTINLLRIQIEKFNRILFFLVFIAHTSSYAGTDGTIRGKVTDEEN